MSDLRDVTPINSLKGKTLISLATGNKLGRVENVFIDPVNGVLHSLTVAGGAGPAGWIAYDRIYSFGRDAIMAESEEAVTPPDSALIGGGRNSNELFGTKVIAESGQVLGDISNIFVTLAPRPFVIYEVRESLLDKLLGRGFYIPASAGHALSEDGERLLVPDAAIQNASADIAELLARTTAVVRSFSPAESAAAAPVDDGDETVVRLRDEDETVVRIRDEDDTVVRLPRKAS